MPISTDIVALIRDEIGNDLDFVDQESQLTGDPAELDSLERIYTDENRGNFSPLVTALICWRRRLHTLQARSFDVTTEGSLLSRNQRIRFIERRIKELELVTDATLKGRNQLIASPLTVAEGILAAEFD